MNMTDRFVRFAAEGEVMAKFSRNLERFGAALAHLHATGARNVCEETHRKPYKQRSLDPNFCSYAAN